MISYTLKYSSEIINLYFFKEQVVYFSRKGEISYINFSHNLPIVDFKFINEGNNYGFFIEDSFCTQSETSIKFYNITDRSVFEVKGKFFIFAKDNKSIYFLDSPNHSFKRLYSKDKKIEALFSFQEEDFLLYPKFLVPSLGIGYSKGNFIKFFNLYKGDFLWQYDLETYFHQPAQIMEGRVLVSNNKIIFFAHTEDWSNYATFVLDAQTGQVLNNPKETIFGGKMYLFDGFLWQKKDKGFAKMNPETFEITHYDLTKDLPTEIIDNRTMAYHNGIIAVSAKPERDSIRSLVLLFDTNTGKIIWRKEILHNESKPSNNENRRQIEEIQMNDKYLAVSTTGFSLYIFEKQDIESK